MGGYITSFDITVTYYIPLSCICQTTHPVTLLVLAAKPLTYCTPKQVVPYNNLYYYYELYKSQLSFNSKDLVGYVLDHMKKHLVKQNQTFLDIGCGCGSISVSLLKEFDKV